MGCTQAIAHVAPNTETALSSYRSKRQQPESTSTEMKTHCDRFVTSVNNTFFSPLDPTSHHNDYPSDANCVRNITAPAGFVIKLDFRNKFHIEPSNKCEYDFLEIRDGQYGFSKLLQKLCGSDFPPIIYSSERYLWLRFHSDENIQYEGFQAVYEFVPRSTACRCLSYAEDMECRFVLNDQEGYADRKDIKNETIDMAIQHSLSLDCLWVIEVPTDWKILLVFENFDLERKNDCDSNFIDIFGEVTEIPSRMRNFCGSIAESVQSKTNKLHVRFFADKNAFNSKFTILYTAYRSKAKGEACDPDNEFDCDDDTCISKALKCNERLNCKFFKDETDPECKDEKDDGNDHLVIIIVVFSLILGAMTTAFLVNCVRKLIRDQKIIREHIRQSKESKLDEAGRMSLKRSLENINRIAPRKQTLQSHQRSIHILDDESNRYYQDAVPVPVTSGSRVDLRSENNYRSQEIKDILDASLRSEKGSQDAGMCDMACQTRESLFAPVFKNKITQAPSNQTPGTIRFSTFGYDTPPGEKTLCRQSVHKDKCRMQPNTIEMEDFAHLTDIPPPPPKVCQKHDPKKNIKMEESRIYVDIRNSAPDVIIMTSH
ncbi:Neuropilin and tolloid-like protein 2 [Pseudolycoriella hygida]|uniref:Neuropilin and tolloid-like protein 2 n=1 Tax=Pseudolycoriella hygida TaxID=35572 RepID=A0A9Q0MS92_9DIPT|nr:Neuropilin and tolloid-like protein 2 [Pseudolycoriella hygida]